MSLRQGVCELVSREDVEKVQGKGESDHERGTAGGLPHLTLVYNPLSRTDKPQQ